MPQPPDSLTHAIHVEGWSRGGGAWSLSEVLPAPDAVLVGAVWEVDATLEVRGQRDGAWGDWLPLTVRDEHGELADGHADDHGHPDGDDSGHGHGDAVTATDPVWLGRSDAIQLRTDAPNPPEVDVTAVAVTGGDGLAYVPPPARAGVSAAATVAGGRPPAIIPRSAWDPKGECRPTEPPRYAPAVKVGYVHHTVMYPHYPPDNGDDVVRAICIFHVRTRGFGDIGYNFLVDKYGRIYEGRAGGVERAVVGAHAAGFNEGSFGVSVVGDFEVHPVPDTAVAAIDELLAWKFSLHGIDPKGTARMVSTAEPTTQLTRFVGGTAVKLPTILGHRDTGSGTLCPGRHLYAALRGAPDRVATLMAQRQKAGASPAKAPAGATDPTAADGTVFTVSLPLAPPELPATGATAATGVFQLLSGAALVRWAGRNRRGGRRNPM